LNQNALSTLQPVMPDTTLPLLHIPALLHIPVAIAARRVALPLHCTLYVAQGPAKHGETCLRNQQRAALMETTCLN